MKKHDIVLWILFFVFLAVRIFFKIQYWIILSLITCSLAIVLLVKAKLPSKKIYMDINYFRGFKSYRLSGISEKSVDSFVWLTSRNPDIVVFYGCLFCYGKTG